MSMKVVLTAALLVLAVFAPVSAGASSLQESSNCTEIHHSAFLESEQALQELNQTGNASATVDNVPVTIEETEQFVRLRASNPNGYCTRVVVEMSEQVAPPAELGTVDAVKPEGSEIQADWSATHSLARDELLTEVVFELPPGAEGVMFAPSKMRVKTLSWTGSAERSANTTVGRLKGLLSQEEELKNDTYHLKRSEPGSITTVSLSSGDGRKVEEWQAAYRTEGGEWRPIGQESSAPVYFTETNQTVKFYYNQPGEVRFTAEPGMTDKAKHDILSYRRSVEDTLDIQLPFTLAPMGAARLTYSESESAL